MKKLVVISGATGMSGSETVRQLLQKGYYVVAFDNFFASSIDSIKDVAQHPNLMFFEYDICNKEQMLKLEALLQKLILYENVGLSFINYAAVVHTKYFYIPSSTFETNVFGMKLFLDMAIRLNAEIYINCSTSEVYSYGSYKEGGVCENEPLHFATAEESLRTSYATGKLQTEFFMKEAVNNGKIKGCSIRFANVYSNDELFPEHIIPHTIDSLLNGNTVKLLTNAKNTYRTFLHNRDSCDAVISLLEMPAILDGSVYNAGTQEEIRIPELVEFIAKKMNRQANIIYEGERSSDPVRRLLNTDKIRSKTNWMPNITLDRGLDMCIAEKCNK
jgi:dTDP-glucose 4,6-dehydratase